MSTSFLRRSLIMKLRLEARQILVTALLAFVGFCVFLFGEAKSPEDRL